MRYGVLGLMALLALGGCARVAYLPTARYILEPAPEVALVQCSNLALGIRPLVPEQPYNQRVLYRADAYQVDYYANAQWAEMPRDVVTRAVTDALIATERFKDVGNAADMRMPDMVLTGQLRAFDENRTTDPWTAECEVRLELRKGLNRDSAWAATMKVSEPMDTNDLPGLAAAMSRAVARVAQQAAAEVASIGFENEM
ncbi:MAG: cholesterol transport system auxiliary component [Candidatus Hydrogenedentes bacterium]|nr:cholesterol transport system auxiliary component [Candidatus Hydrogenedentota bacterium]